MSNNEASESEAYVIGALIKDNQLFGEVKDSLSASDFQTKDIRIAYKAISQLVERGESADVTSISSLIMDRGGDDLLMTLGNWQFNATSGSNISTHSKRIKSKSLERTALAKLVEAQSIIMGSGETAEKMNAIAELVSAIETDDLSGKPAYKTMKEIGMKLLDALDDRMDPNTPNGLTTGIESFDRLLGARGLQPKDFVIIGARPAGGKSMVAGKIGLHVAVALQRPVQVFSLEMGDTELMQRYISQIGKVNGGVFYDGARLDNEIGKIQHAMVPLMECPMVIDDRAGLTFNMLAKSARQFKKANPDVAMIILDYIMLMKVDSVGKRQDQAYGDVSMALIALGKELNVTMVILSQCSKACESRPDRRPLASDLKEISQLEADATHVLMLYNESAYVEDTPLGKAVELILRKNRHGSLGTAYQEIKGGWMEDISDAELGRRQAANQSNKSAGYGDGGGYKG